MKSRELKFHKVISLSGYVFMAFMFLYFILSIQNSDQTIGYRIAKETYTNEAGEVNRGEWMWNLGQFIAIMAGWYWILSISGNYYDWAWRKRKKRNSQ